MITVHNLRDQSTKSYLLKPGCNVIGSCLMADIRINNKQIDPIHLVMNHKLGILMVRDNQSDKGTFKKQRTSRMNLSPNTLYEFNLEQESEDEMVFFLGDVKLEFKEEVNIEQEEDEKDYQEMDVPKKNNLFQPNIKPKVNIIDDATQIIDQNFNFNSKKIGNAVDATLILNHDKGNDFAMPMALSKKKQPAKFLQPVPNFNDQTTQLITNNKSNINDLQQDFDQTLILPQNNHKTNKNNDMMDDATQIINHNHFNKYQEATQLIAPLNKKPQIDFDATIILDEKKVIKNDIQATILINQPKRQEDQNDDLRLLDSDDSQDINESPEFGRQNRKRVITDSVEDIIDALDNEKEEKEEKMQEEKNQLSKILEESSDDENAQHPKNPPLKFTQEKQIKEKKVKMKEEDRHDEIHGSIDDILEQRDELQQEVQSQRYNKRKRDQISNSNQDVKGKDPALSQQAIKKRKIDSQNNDQSQKANLRGKAKDQEEEKVNSQNNKYTILVTGDAKEPQYQKIIKSLNGKVVTDIDKEINVMVSGKLIRNAKLLYAINVGAPIVSIQWLKDSQSKGKFQDLDKYLLKDKDFEKTYNCNLKALFDRKNKNQLLQGMRAFISKNIQGISKETMAFLVTSAGGEEANEKNKNEASFMIVDEVKDKKLIQSFKGKKDAPHICGIELMLEGILQQKFDFKKFSLLK